MTELMYVLEKSGDDIRSHKRFFVSEYTFQGDRYPATTDEIVKARIFRRKPKKRDCYFGVSFFPRLLTDEEYKEVVGFDRYLTFRRFL